MTCLTLPCVYTDVVCQLRSRMGESVDRLIGRNHALIMQAWATRMVSCDVGDRIVVTTHESAEACRTASDLHFAVALAALRRSFYPSSRSLLTVREATWAARASRKQSRRT
jgi:hypothetical protein